MKRRRRRRHYLKFVCGWHARFMYTNIHAYTAHTSKGYHHTQAVTGNDCVCDLVLLRHTHIVYNLIQFTKYMYIQQYHQVRMMSHALYIICAGDFLAMDTQREKSTQWLRMLTIDGLSLCLNHIVVRQCELLLDNRGIEAHVKHRIQLINSHLNRMRVLLIEAFRDTHTHTHTCRLRFAPMSCRVVM